MPSRTVCFVAATQIPSGEQLLFLTRILAITITMWIAFRESSHGVMPCIVVISVLPEKESIMLFIHAELQKQYREAYERDHAVNNRLVVQKGG